MLSKGYELPYSTIATSAEVHSSAQGAVELAIASIAEESIKVNAQFSSFGSSPIINYSNFIRVVDFETIDENMVQKESHLSLPTTNETISCIGNKIPSPDMVSEEIGDGTVSFTIDTSHLDPEIIDDSILCFFLG